MLESEYEQGKAIHNQISDLSAEGNKEQVQSERGGYKDKTSYT